MKTAHPGLIVFLGIIAACIFEAPVGAQTSVLDTLRPGHPRLIMLDSDLPTIRKSIQEEEFSKQNYAMLRERGEKILSESAIAYGAIDATQEGSDQQVEGRIITLAGLYRITGEKRYFDGAKREVLAAANLPDWHPQKAFLGTSEMTAGVAIGYDWLYQELTPAERLTIRDAIMKKGIQPWVDDVRSGGKVSRMQNNWVQVCTGGITLGVLAVADEEPDLAREALEDSRRLMQHIMTVFAPDGGDPEGPKYWVYATTYNVLYLAALDSALGTDFGLSEMPGFSTTGDYRVQTMGPLWRAANFSDAYEDCPIAPQMFWMANRFHHPEYAVQEERFDRAIDTMSGGHPHEKNERFTIFSILWYKPVPPAEDVEPLLVRGFDRIGQAFLRSSWNDQNAWYLAFKGGSNTASHSHLDLGTFVLDALGQRWAMDLGLEKYDVPDYFKTDGPRWTYYRTRTEGHNTLVVDDENQDLDGNARLVLVKKSATDDVAVLDLGDAYKGKLKSWKRGIALSDGHSAIVQDEVVPAEDAKIVWHFHTRATIAIAPSGREATLSQGSTSVQVRILAPSLAHFENKSAQAPPPQSKNEGVSDLVIQISDPKDAETISIFFSAAGNMAAPPAVLPLSSWGDR